MKGAKQRREGPREKKGTKDDRIGPGWEGGAQVRNKGPNERRK